MNVRTATQEDISNILALGVLMFTEAATYGDTELDLEEVTTALTYLIDSPNAIVLVVEADDQLVGFYIGGVGKAWYSKTTRVMFEQAFYIHPDHRGGTTAIHMLQEAFAQAKSKGATKAELHTTTGVRTERTQRLFEYLGMDIVGATYHKKL